MSNSICELCTGCRACEKICPKNAIKMSEDNEGFKIAEIDMEKCVNCGLCKKLCPQNNNYTNVEYFGKAYAAQIKDSNILLQSSSGGFFSCLAREILNKDGVVFGATIDDNLNVFHMFIENENDLKLLRSSKYVVSDTKNTYSEVKKFLEDDRYVLYSGVPCQIAGLKAFLNKKYDKLITIDVICHGTPNYKLFDIYRKGMEEKLKSPITDYKFRDKTKRGWGVYWSFKYKAGKKHKTGGLNDDPYISAFINGSANKEACYKCKYVGFEKRMADITLGDFWGVDKFHPDMASNDGVSAVIINNKAVESLVDKALEQCRFVETQKENIAKYNSCLIKNNVRPKERDYIYSGINNKDAKKFLENNLKIRINQYVKTKIRLLMPYKLRVLVKKFFK